MHRDIELLPTAQGVKLDKKLGSDNLSPQAPDKLYGRLGCATCGQNIIDEEGFLSLKDGVLMQLDFHQSIL
jgi:hypothetical protein